MYEPKVSPIKAQSQSFEPHTSLSILIHLNNSHVPDSPVAVPAYPQTNTQKSQMESTQTLNNLPDTPSPVPSESADARRQMASSLYSMQSPQSQQTASNNHANYREYTRAAKTPLSTTNGAEGVDMNATQLFCSTDTPAPHDIQTQYPLFQVASIPEDLGYSLRNFMVASPSEDANALFARIAVRGGHSTGKNVHALSHRSLKSRSDSKRADSAEEDDRYLV